WTAMSTWLGPGSGTGSVRSLMTDGGPNRSLAAAFIVAGTGSVLREALLIAMWTSGESNVGTRWLAASSAAVGTKLVVQLEQPIDKHTQPGQRYTALVTQKVIDSKGQPIIPVGSQVMGRVISVHKSEKDKPAVVNLNVDSLIVNGMSHPIGGRIRRRP